ncbi:MAG: NADP-dependent oxidoreductase [Lysobacter sp.]|nr:NADP-dependent oxidoreductase [Lysobacter sp.]
MAAQHAAPRPPDSSAHAAPVKAVVFDRYGAPEVLHAIELPMPQAGPGEIRVRVRAAGVRPSDIAARSGLNRDGESCDIDPLAFPRRLGNEFAGIVDQVGAGVDAFAPGDEVMGWAVAMSYAEVLTVPAEQVVHKPVTMSCAVAGALPSTGQTALAALRNLRLRRGERVLIHGAASGIGSVAVQLARAWGLSVIGSAAEADHDYLRALGALPIDDDHRGNAQARALAPDGVDAVFDALGVDRFDGWLAPSGDERLDDRLALCRDPGRIATLCDSPRARRLGLQIVRSQRSRARLAELVAMHERHGLLVHVREMFPLTRAAEAHRAVERGPGRGKVVLMVYAPLALRFCA